MFFFLHVVPYSHWYEFNIWRRKNSDETREARPAWVRSVCTLKISKAPIKNQLERNNGILFNSTSTIASLKRVHFDYWRCCKENNVWFRSRPRMYKCTNTTSVACLAFFPSFFRFSFSRCVHKKSDFLATRAVEIIDSRPNALRMHVRENETKQVWFIRQIGFVLNNGCSESFCIKFTKHHHQHHHHQQQHALSISLASPYCMLLAYNFPLRSININLKCHLMISNPIRFWCTPHIACSATSIKLFPLKLNFEFPFVFGERHNRLSPWKRIYSISTHQ